MRTASTQAALDALHPALFPLSPLTVSFFHRKAVEPSPPADFMRHALRLAFAQWMAAKPRRFIRALETNTFTYVSWNQFHL